jgi:hypothetical protein
VNGQVLQCWDYRPPQAKIDEEGGWQEAVEVTPDVQPHREMITNHYFDTTKTPVEIVWNKREILVDERKEGIRGELKRAFEKVVQNELSKELDDFLDTHYDANVVEAARQSYLNKLQQINNLSTHDEFEAFVNSL